MVSSLAAPPRWILARPSRWKGCASVGQVANTDGAQKARHNKQEDTITAENDTLPSTNLRKVESFIDKV